MITAWGRLRNGNWRWIDRLEVFWAFSRGAWGVSEFSVCVYWGRGMKRCRGLTLLWRTRPQ